MLFDKKVMCLSVLLSKRANCNLAGTNDIHATVGAATSRPRSIIHKNKPGWANSYDVRHDTIQRNTQFRYVAGGYEPPLRWLGNCLSLVRRNVTGHPPGVPENAPARCAIGCGPARQITIYPSAKRKRGMLWYQFTPERHPCQFQKEKGGARRRLPCIRFGNYLPALAIWAATSAAKSSTFFSMPSPLM